MKTPRTAYETGVFGKGIVIGRIIKKEKVRTLNDEQYGYLILQNSYRRYRKEILKKLPDYIKVYKEKEGIIVDNTSSWEITSLPTRLRCPIEKFDKEATYYVDYKVFNFLYYNLKELSIPAKQGTIEMFFRLDWEYPNNPVLYPGFFQLIGAGHGQVKSSISLHGPRFICLNMKPGVIGGYTETSINVDVHTLPHIKKGEWHHIAFVWDKKKGVYYIDGEKHCEVKHKEMTDTWEKLIVGSLADHWPTFGGMRLFGVIDEFRFSDIARTSEEIANSALGTNELKCDKHTVVLCHFENTPDGECGIE